MNEIFDTLPYSYCTSSVFLAIPLLCGVLFSVSVPCKAPLFLIHLATSDDEDEWLPVWIQDFGWVYYVCLLFLGLCCLGLVIIVVEDREGCSVLRTPSLLASW